MFSKKTLIGLIVATLAFVGLGVFLSGSASASPVRQVPCVRYCTTQSQVVVDQLTSHGYQCNVISTAPTTWYCSVAPGGSVTTLVKPKLVSSRFIGVPSQPSPLQRAK